MVLCTKKKLREEVRVFPEHTMQNPRNSKFDWKTIEEESLAILIESHASGTKPMKLSELYAKLKEKYEKKGKLAPGQNTYRQEMHKRLKIPNNQRATESELYRLAGLYPDMTLEMLACHLDITNAAPEPDDKWLLVRLKRDRKKSSYTSLMQHMYYLTKKIKEKFGDDILFISFDNNTLVIMCRDLEAKSAIYSYFKSIFKKPDTAKKSGEPL